MSAIIFIANATAIFTMIAMTDTPILNLQSSSLYQLLKYLKTHLNQEI